MGLGIREGSAVEKADTREVDQSSGCVPSRAAICARFVCDSGMYGSDTVAETTEEDSVPRMLVPARREPDVPPQSNSSRSVHSAPPDGASQEG